MLVMDMSVRGDQARGLQRMYQQRTSCVVSDLFIPTGKPTTNMLVISNNFRVN